MSQKICQSFPYWWAPDWHPRHMTIEWLDKNLPPASPPSKMSKKRWDRKNKARRMARRSRQINRGK